MPTTSAIPSDRPDPRQSPFVPGVQPPEPFTLVIFGATGDLAARKLFPALHGLWRGRFLPRDFAVVGVGRRDKNDEAFRQDVRRALAELDRADDFLANVF